MNTTYLVVGGGIAGVSCVESLAIVDQEQSVTLLTASTLIKQVTNVSFYAKTITKFDVEETEASTLQKIHKNLSIIYDTLSFINSKENVVKTGNGSIINYRYLCLCTGGIPKTIHSAPKSENIITIRDTDSVASFLSKIKTCTRLLVVGNGGIASEVIYNTKGVEKIWLIKDNYISSTFVDPGAAEFFQSALKSEKSSQKPPTMIKRHRFGLEDKVIASAQGNIKSAALGPDWLSCFCDKPNSEHDDKLQMHYNSEINSIHQTDNKTFPLAVKLKNSIMIECDLILLAIGVDPAINFKTDTPFALALDHGIKVDETFLTNIPNIYAAGDCCTANWTRSEHWFQMRLWTQARQMGSSVGKQMWAKRAEEPIYQDFCFELFTHCTTLYGYQVVLLGAYNGQGLNNDYEILLRVTRDVEYIKLVLKSGRLQGAILIGDTGLEEMCENLILNQIDLTPFGEDILDPNIDIDDYFD